MSNPNGREKTALIAEALTPDRVCFLDAGSKDPALRVLAEHIAASPHAADSKELVDAIFRREELMSTGIGLGLAVPHVRLASVRELIMAVGISRDGLTDYASLDDGPVHIVFMIAAPAGQHAEYIRLLSAISTRAKQLNGRLRECPDEQTAYRLLTANDTSESSGGL